MARDRSIKLVIQAEVNGAKRALNEVAESAKKVGTAAQESAAKSSSAGSKLAQSARDNSQAWSTAGTAVAGFGAVLVGGFTAATVANMGFEKSLSNVKAVTNASASEMDALAQSALQMGADTVFSASEAATAQAELARAGVSTADILGGALAGSMDLAAAGGLDLADAAIISAQAMNLFNLEGRDVGHIADVLASGANKSAADVSDLGQALGQAGTVASQTGLSLEETVGALSMFADAGIRGSDAGTSLKSMLQRLTPQSKEAQRVMEDLGFSAFDAQGNFIGLEALAGELQSSFGGLDTESRQAALGVAFGSDAIRAASVLMEGGTTAAADYTAAMDDQGAAARMAATQMDNLAGDVEELSGSLETAFIKSGSVANDFLRGMVTGATDLVNVYNDLPGSVQATVTVLGGALGAASLAAGGFLLLAPRIVETQDAFRTLATSMPATTRALSGVKGILMGPWGLALGAAAVAVGVWAHEQGEARREAEELAATLDKQTGSLTNNSREWFASALSDGGILEAAERLGIDLDLVTDAASGNTEAIAQLNGELAATVPAVEGTQRGLSGLQRDARAVQGAIDGSNVTLEAARDVNRRLAEAMGETATSAGLVGEGFVNLALGMSDYATAQLAAVGGADLFLTAGEKAALLGEDAAKAYADWAEETRGVSESFVSAQGALGVANEAAQTWAQGVADATDSADDSWEDYVGDFTGTVDEWLAELTRMQEAQSAWETNMIILASRASDGVVQAFEDMGPEGAVLLQEFLDGGVATLAQGEALFGDEARRATQAYADGMADADVIRAAAARWGDDIAEGLAAQLEAGETTVAAIVSEYDLATEIELQANPDPFDGKLADVLAFASGQVATAGIDGDATGYGAALGAALGTADRSVATAEIDGDASAYLNALSSVLGTTDRSSATAAILGNANPAFGALGGLLRTISDSSASVTAGARTGNAESSVYGLLGWIGRQSATVSVYTRMMGALNLGASLGTIPNRAAGGIERYAGGNVRRPMMMGPGYGPTNVILAGEPETRGEAFISNHPNYKAQNVQYLKTAASWFGMDVVKAYASGGVAQQWSGAAGSDSSELAGQVATLSAAVAAMPGLIEVPVYMDSRETARATARGMDKLGGRVVTPGRTRIGRRS